MNTLTIRIITILSAAICLVCCSRDNTGLISTEQESYLGVHLDSVLRNNSLEFQVLDTASYPDAYDFLYGMLDTIVSSSELSRPGIFTFTIRIVENTDQNFYAFPGGFLYINTGFIDYLDNGAQLAGIMAHQVAHIDRRHITGIIERELGFDEILKAVTGREHASLDYLTEAIASGNGLYKYSDKQELEADEYAVRYTASTAYDPTGIASFLSKVMLSVQSGSVPEIANDHPLNDKRLEHINQVWIGLDSPEGELFTSEFEQFRTAVHRK